MKRRVGNCPVCRNQVGITKAGYVVGHRITVNVDRVHTSRATCAGSGTREAVTT